MNKRVPKTYRFDAVTVKRIVALAAKSGDSFTDVLRHAVAEMALREGVVIHAAD